VPGYSNLTLASRYTWYTNLGTDFTLLDAEGDNSSATVNCASGYQCSLCNADYSLPLLAYRLDDISLWVTLTINTQHSTLNESYPSTFSLASSPLACIPTFPLVTAPVTIITQP